MSNNIALVLIYALTLAALVGLVWIGVSGGRRR